MSSYTVTLVDHPAKQLVGMKVHTSMQKAQADCPALWMAFGARMQELFPNCTDCKGSYGISAMINEEEFYYWAAVEMDNSAPLPEGMERIAILAGPYATCTVPNLEKLGDAYMFLYGTWPQQSGRKYAHAPCVEHYGPNWQMTDALEIFMPREKETGPLCLMHGPLTNPPGQFFARGDLSKQSTRAAAQCPE